MNSRIVQIGNSRGIRLPKVLLEEAQLADEVELQAEPGVGGLGSGAWMNKLSSFTYASLTLVHRFDDN
jgi:hypothetical protein